MNALLLLFWSSGKGKCEEEIRRLHGKHFLFTLCFCSSCLLFFLGSSFILGGGHLFLFFL